VWFFTDPLEALLESLLSIATTSAIKSHTTHVPTFYAPNTGSSDDDAKLIFFGVPVIAAIFGALHCIAWNFHFPSHIEQLLWRIGSLTITLTPSVPFVIVLVMLIVGAPFFLLRFLEKKYDFPLSVPSFSLPQCVVTVLDVMLATLWAIMVFLAGAGLVAYMLARLLLLMQAIVLLRKQPESAFYAINWANFLPHI